MTTMLEKMSVAMAVCEMRRNGMSESLCQVASVHPAAIATALEHYGPQARAALQAIREPDEVMLKAGRTCEPFMMPPGERWTPGKIIASAVYESMIDAILNEPNTTP